MFRKIAALFLPGKERKFADNIKIITGLYPGNLELYHMASRHTSAAKEGVTDSNERLEYLGDAVLSAVVAELLFKKYPFKTEGFLTEIRSRLVNRETLNKLGLKIGLDKIVVYHNARSPFSHKSLYGDALEALIGAVYLDHGFRKCKIFILSRLIYPHLDLEAVASSHKNFKSLLIEWAQKENKEIKFVITNEITNKSYREFTAEVIICDETISSGKGLSKKKAEQAAAEKACTELKLIEE